MADLSLFQRLAASCATMLPLLAKEEQEEARKMVVKMLMEQQDKVEQEDKTGLDQKELKVEMVNQSEVFDHQPKKMLDEVKKVKVEVEVTNIMNEVEINANVCDKDVAIKERPSFWPNEWDFSGMTMTSLKESEAGSWSGNDEGSQSVPSIASLPQLTITNLDSGSEIRSEQDESSQHESKLTIANLLEPESKVEEMESGREQTEMVSEFLGELRGLLKSVSLSPRSESKPEERESLEEEIESYLTDTAAVQPDNGAAKDAVDENTSELMKTKDLEEEAASVSEILIRYGEVIKKENPIEAHKIVEEEVKGESGWRKKIKIETNLAGRETGKGKKRGSNKSGRCTLHCTGCSAEEDCNSCKFCLDKPRLGGANKRRDIGFRYSCPQDHQNINIFIIFAIFAIFAILAIFFIFEIFAIFSIFEIFAIFARERKSRSKPTWQKEKLERRRKEGQTSVEGAQAALLKKIATVASSAWTSQGLGESTR